MFRAGSALQFLPQHFQLQPFLFHADEVGAQLLRLGGELVEGRRVLGEEIGIGHLRLARGDLLDDRDIIQQQLEIDAEKIRQRRGRAHADDVDMLCREDHIDCLVKVLECPRDAYEAWVGLLPEGEARRKMSGLLTFGEIHIDANHAGMLGKAFAEAMPGMDEPYKGWSAILMEQLAAIQREPALYLMVQLPRRME